VGASGWEYAVPYQEDLGAALDKLRRQVFASGDWVKPDYYGDVFDLPSIRNRRAFAVKRLRITCDYDLGPIWHALLSAGASPLRGS
jgi:hypothetical protein